MKKLLILIAVMFLFGCEDNAKTKLTTQTDFLISSLENIELDRWQVDNNWLCIKEPKCVCIKIYEISGNEYVNLFLRGIGHLKLTDAQKKRVKILWHNNIIKWAGRNDEIAEQSQSQKLEKWIKEWVYARRKEMEKK